MGEYLSGDRRVNTPYDIRYRVAEEWRELCSVDLTAAQVDELIVAIEQVSRRTANTGTSRFFQAPPPALRSTTSSCSWMTCPCGVMSAKWWRT